MNISQDIKPITYLKSRAADLLKHINETHRPVIITQNGEPKAVLQDPESYDNMRNAIGILKLISLGEERHQGRAGNSAGRSFCRHGNDSAGQAGMNKKYEVIWSNTAARDFEHIIAYIAHDSPANAQKYSES